MVEWLKGLGWVISFLIGWLIFKWLPDHPEYMEKILYYFIRLIPFTFSWKKRKRIEKEIHAYITEEIIDVNNKSFGFKILPKGVKIEWTLKKKEKVVIEENEIIIRLGSRVNSCENFVDALILYLSESFMPNGKIYLEPTLYEACKFQIAISMLRNRPDEYYQVFMNKYYKPSLGKHPKKILDYSEKLEYIEKEGLFIPIFLSALSFYIEKWIFQRRSPSLKIQQEINAFFDFIHGIATRKEYELEKGEEPPLTYDGKYIKVGVILIAREELAKQSNYIPHLKRAKEELKKCDILFVSGRGKNTALAEIVALKLKEEPFCEQIDGASKFYFYPEENKKIEGRCYVFKRKI